MTDNKKLYAGLKKFVGNGGELEKVALAIGTGKKGKNYIHTKGLAVLDGIFYRIPDLYWLESVLVKFLDDDELYWLEISISEGFEGDYIIQNQHEKRVFSCYFGNINDRKSACLDIINQVVASSPENKQKLKEIMENENN